MNQLLQQFYRDLEVGTSLALRELTEGVEEAHCYRDEALIRCEVQGAYFMVADGDVKLHMKTRNMRRALPLPRKSVSLIATFRALKSMIQISYADRQILQRAAILHFKQLLAYLEKYAKELCLVPFLGRIELPKVA